MQKKTIKKQHMLLMVSEIENYDLSKKSKNYLKKTFRGNTIIPQPQTNIHNYLHIQFVFISWVPYLKDTYPFGRDRFLRILVYILFVMILSFYF